MTKEELEKENAELEEKISILLSCKNCPENKDGLLCQKEYEDKCLAQKIQFIKELQEENAELKEKLKTAYRKGMRHMAKALKDYDRKFGAWTDYFEHTVDTVLQKEQVAFEEYGTLTAQLLKAKSILTLFLVANDNDDMLKAQREAWAFLGIVNPNDRYEITELEKQLEMSNKVYNDNLDYSHHIEGQLTKAKELLNEFMRISKASDEDFEHDYSELIGEAEQFLKDCEVEK